MPLFSAGSLVALASCDPRWKPIVTAAIRDLDFKVTEGWRGKPAQDAAVAAGLSQTPWPTSKHNTLDARGRPASLAIHLVPWPIDWGEDGTAAERHKALARFYYLAGWIGRIGVEQGLQIRWGGDWDGDHDPRDQTFDDLAHYELTPAPKPAIA